MSGVLYQRSGKLKLENEAIFCTSPGHKLLPEMMEPTVDNIALSKRGTNTDDDAEQVVYFASYSVGYYCIQ